MPFPDPEGELIEIVGATEYPRPAFVRNIFEIVPAALTTAVAAAETVVTPDKNNSFVKVIVGKLT